MWLGFHRLGQTLEDEVNLGVALALGWAIVVLMIAVAAAISFPTAILLILCGVAVIALLRGQVTRLAHDWRRGRLRLERRHGRTSS